MSDSVWPHRWQPTRLCRPWDSPGKNTGVGCHFLLQCMKVKSESEVTQLCLTLRDPMDCSLPGSSMGFSRQKYWNRLPFPSPGDLPDQGIKPGSPTFQAHALTSEPPGKPQASKWSRTKCFLEPLLLCSMRAGLWRKLSTKESMLLNYGVEDSWESLGLQGDKTSQS